MEGRGFLFCKMLHAQLGDSIETLNLQNMKRFLKVVIKNFASNSSWFHVISFLKLEQCKNNIAFHERVDHYKVLIGCFFDIVQQMRRFLNLPSPSFEPAFRTSSDSCNLIALENSLRVGHSLRKRPASQEL